MNKREFNDLFSKKLDEISVDKTLDKEAWESVVANNEEIKNLVRQRKISIEKQTAVITLCVAAVSAVMVYVIYMYLWKYAEVQPLIFIPIGGILVSLCLIFKCIKTIFF